MCARTQVVQLAPGPYDCERTDISLEREVRAVLEKDKAMLEALVVTETLHENPNAGDPKQVLDMYRAQARERQEVPVSSPGLSPAGPRGVHVPATGVGVGIAPSSPTAHHSVLSPDLTHSAVSMSAAFPSPTDPVSATAAFLGLPSTSPAAPKPATGSSLDFAAATATKAPDQGSPSIFATISDAPVVSSLTIAQKLPAPLRVVPYVRAYSDFDEDVDSPVALSKPAAATPP